MGKGLFGPHGLHVCRVKQWRHFKEAGSEGLLVWGRAVGGSDYTEEGPAFSMRVGFFNFYPLKYR